MNETTVGEGAPHRDHHKAADAKAVTDEPLQEKENRGYHQPGVLRVLQTKDETRAFYDKIAKVYDLLAERSEEPVRQAGLEMLDARTGEKVLEVGFGTGHSLIKLARAVGPAGKGFGIDVSEKMRQIAQERVHQEGLDARIELTCGDASHLPYPSGMLDGIFMSFTLELFDTPEIPQVLAECRRVLRDGGRLAWIIHEYCDIQRQRRFGKEMG